MKFLNVGLPELAVLIVIALIFLGPDGMRENARKLAVSMRKLLHSDTWRTINGMYHEVKGYPEKLMREAELDELRETLRRENEEINESIHKP